MDTTSFTEAELREQLNWLGFEDGEIEVRRDYSGRGMYGETCFGIVHPRVHAAIGAAISRAIDHNSDFGELYDIIGAATNDHMGLDIITYFPGWKLP